MNTVVYPVSRVYYEKVLPSVKSLMCRSDADRIILTIEDDEYPGYLPECVETLNAQKVSWRYFKPDGPNIRRTPYVYLCMLRTAYAYLFPDCDRVLCLDADTLAVNEMGSDPWTMDLEGCHVAGVPELKISRELGRPYVNAGVLIMDLDAIRSDGLAPVMLDRMNSKAYQWLEQDCINECCRVKPLDPGWNLCQFTSRVDLPDAKILHWAYDVRGWEQNAERKRYEAMSWEEAEEIWRNRKRG